MKVNRRNDIGIMIKGIKTLYCINKKHALYSFVHIICSVACMYIPIYLSAQIVNEVVLLSSSNKATTLSRVVVLIIITLGTCLFLNLLGRFSAQKKSIHSIRFFLDEKKMFAKKSMDVKYENTEKKAVALLKARIDAENQTGYNMWMLNTSVEQLIYGLMGIVISLLFVIQLLCINIMSSFSKVVLLTLLGVVIGVNSYCDNKINNIDNKTMEKWAPLNQWSNYYKEYLNDYKNGKDIRMFGMKQLIMSNVAQMSEKYISFFRNANHIQCKYIVTKNFFLTLLKISVYVYVIMACIHGEVTIGEIAAYVAYIVLCVQDFMKMIKGWQQLKNNCQYLERYFEFLELDEEGERVENLTNHISLEKCCIEFCNVSFKYPDSNEYILKNLNLCIKNKEKIAIVGRNGSGKTTFIKLLCRLYEPTEGEILLNGKRIADYGYDEYIKRISVIFQDYALFSLTIKENIAGSKTYDENRIINCLRQVENTSDISNKLDSYIYKYVSDDGLELSGGETQKIAIARALYKNGDIMILDEPTSAMDAESEEKVFIKLKKIAEDKNVFFVSHRLSACTICDRILVFDNGGIVQQGIHDELLEQKSGLYYSMWISQTKNYLV